MTGPARGRVIPRAQEQRPNIHHMDTESLPNDATAKDINKFAGQLEGDKGQARRLIRKALDRGITDIKLWPLREGSPTIHDLQGTDPARITEMKAAGVENPSGVIFLESLGVPSPSPSEAQPSFEITYTSGETVFPYYISGTVVPAKIEPKTSPWIINDPDGAVDTSYAINKHEIVSSTKNVPITTPITAWNEVAMKPCTYKKRLEQDGLVIDITAKVYPKGHTTSQIVNIIDKLITQARLRAQIKNKARKYYNAMAKLFNIPIKITSKHKDGV